MADKATSYRQALKKMGSSVPIEVVEDKEIELGFTEVARIQSSGLDEVELSYIINCLLLSEKVKMNDEVIYKLESLTDPEIS